MSKNTISPSLMCMDLTKFKEQINFLDKHVESYHIDIMDGHFVPNITLSPWFIEQVKKISDTPISVHMMVDDPAFWVPQLVDLETEWICMHAETLDGCAFRLIDQIHDAGLKAGVVINPETTVESIVPYIDIVDRVTVMTVDPGFAGQRFLESTLSKVTQLKKLREKMEYNYIIEIDGSGNKNNFKKMSEAGTEVFIVGNSGLFSLDEDISAAWEQLCNDFEQETGKSIW